MEKSSCPDPACPGMGAGPAAGEIAAKEGEGGTDEGAAAGSGGFGHACIGRWLTVEHRQELHRVVRLTAPLVSKSVRASGLLSDILHNTTCRLHTALNRCSHMYKRCALGEIHHVSKKLHNQSQGALPNGAVISLEVDLHNLLRRNSPMCSY